MIEIDKNISLPASSGRGAKAKYPFGSMEIGDSFPIPEGKKMSVYLSSRSWANSRKLLWKFSVRKDEAGAYRCWRVE